ncbi:hypothetical protein SteCoe_12572 [Stentor coeruleus]|uniref:Chorein N-terminal domain-containing protein n=1 Tax=Stentor coeruleus TaxID=5963 RepID=A0A1R2CAG7_9CILI|nr:hypothetical protein SteCoe_12572 [Stentor coeruleus]
MNGAVASVLNKVLGDWIENLNSENLNLSVFSGDILLENLNLKASAFDNLGLPFRLSYGYVGKISANIPWTSLAKSPLRIQISNIHMCLSPIPTEDWKEDFEISRHFSNKLTKLRQLEAISDSEIETKTQGFVEKLVGKVVHNLQIDIKNVYIRYSDSISSTSKFAFGIVLDELKAVTCDELWNENFIEESSVMYKLVEVKNFRVFMDYNLSGEAESRNIAEEEFKKEVEHRFLLPKTSLRLQATVNKKSGDFSMPQVGLEMETSAFVLNLDTIQLSHLLKTGNFLSLFEKFQKGIVGNIREEPFTQEEAEKYRSLYIENKTPKKRKDKQDEIIKNLESFEKLKDWDGILQQRKIADKEFELAQQESLVQEELKSASAPVSSSYFSGFFSRKPNISEEEKKDKIDKIKMKLKKINEEREKLTNEVESWVSDVEVFVDFPSNFIKFYFKFFMVELSLIIGQGDTRFIAYNLKKLKCEVHVSKEFFICKAGISGSELMDLENSSAFPYIIRSKGYELDVTNKGGLSIGLMSSGEVEMVVKLRTILKTIDSIKDACESQIDYSQYTQNATENTKKYITQGERYISEVMTSGIKTSLKLNIHLEAPNIIVPLNPENPESQQLIIDFGSIILSNSPQTIDTTTYDKYIFRLRNFEIFTTSSSNLNNRNCIMKPITIDVILYNILTENSQVPAFILEIVFYQISIFLEDSTLSFLLSLKKSILQELSSISKPPPLDPDLLKTNEEIQISLMTKFIFKIQNININLILNSNDLATAEISDIGIEVLIKSKKNIQCDFHLGFIELRDNRQGVKINKIICNPILQPADDEFADAVEELKQFSGKVLYDGTTCVDFLLNDLRICVPAEFCGKLQEFTKEVTKGHDFLDESLKIKEKDIKKDEPLEVSSGLIKIKAEMSNITILLPLDATRLDKRVGMFNVSISLDFSSEKTAEDNKYLAYSETAIVNFKKITSVVGLFANNMVKNTHQKTENLFMPTQFELKYNKFLESNNFASSIDFTLDKIAIDAGFRDLDFFQKLTETWKALQVPTPTSQTELKPPSIPIKLNLTSSSISIKFTDDTLIKPVPLIFACISKFDLSANINGKEISFKVFSKLYIQCYYFKDFRLITEALIEEWEFNAKFLQKEKEVPYDFQLYSDKFLNINISENMLGTLARLVKKFSLDPEFWAKEIKDERDDDFVYVVNELGEDIVVSCPDENHKIVEKNKRFSVKNTGESREKFVSHFILQADNSNQVYIEITGCTKEFTIKRNNNYVSCLLQLQENTEEITFILRTETELLNLTDKFFEVSSSFVKLKLPPMERINLPLSFYDQEMKVLSDSGPSVFTGSFIFSGGHYNIEKLSMKDEQNFLHLIYVFVPSFYIQNLLPCPLVLYHQPMTSLRVTVLPGESKELPVNPRSLGKIQMSLTLDSPMPTAWIDLTTSSCKIELPANHNKIMLDTIEYDIFSKLPNFIPISRNINCKLFQVYSRYIVINRTNLNLEFKKNLQVEKSSMCFVRARRDKIRIRAQVGNKYSGYSKEINTNTVGVSGCLNMESARALNVEEILLGVQILSSPLPLVKSKLIVISPRFTVSNRTSRNLYIRQLIDGKPGNIVTRIVGENMPYQLENSYQSKVVQISTNSKHWSNGFNLEEITDFQVSLESLVEERLNSTQWYLPNNTNDYRTFVQVSISSEDQSTISLLIRDPSHPEFTIANNTEFPLILSRDKYTFTIPPGVELPWADSTSVTIRKDRQEITYSLLKVKRKKKSFFDIAAEVRISGVTRRLELGKKKEIPEKNVWESSSQVKFMLSGIGISLFTKEPKELFFFSIFNIFVWVKITEGHGQSKLKTDIKIGKIQLDNMDKEDTQYAVMFTGTDDTETPFFQSKLRRLSTESFTRFPWAEVNFQELQVQLNQEVLYKIIDFVGKIKDTFLDQAEYTPVGGKTLIEAFPELSPELQLIENKPKSSMKIYMNYLRLYTLKINVSFKVQSKKFEFQLDPRQAFGVRSAAVGLVSSFVNITDSPLVFTQILITDSFQTPLKLADTLIQNYKQQGIRQVYRLLGSSDMLGNPIRLMNKLGTGVFEFISEPVKGVLQGPKEFKDGVKIGVKSLVSNIVGGGFQTVSTITGSLYNVVNKVKGAEQKDLSGEKLGGSILGGLKDIGKGVTGIFSKPLSGLKNEGGTGFLKGIGTGFMGAVTAPISAGLRISSGLTSEVSSAVSVKRPDVNRIREPKALRSK